MEKRLEILFSDKDIIVCIKPAGVVSEDAPGGMPELIRAELPGSSVYPVHRLDKGVGGVMIYALTKEAAADLTRQITEKTFTKEYLAVVEGVPEPLSGRMEDLLFHSSRENRTYVVKRMRKGVKEAALEYEVIKSAPLAREIRTGEEGSGLPVQHGNAETEAGGPTGTPHVLSLVRIRLLTGRTHQIRAQFSSRKLPLSGDRRYGAKTSGDIALWSHRLSFRHPETGELRTFEAAPAVGRHFRDFFKNDPREKVM